MVDDSQDKFKKKEAIITLEIYSEDYEQLCKEDVGESTSNKRVTAPITHQ